MDTLKRTKGVVALKAPQHTHGPTPKEPPFAYQQWLVDNLDEFVQTGSALCNTVYAKDNDFLVNRDDVPAHLLGDMIIDHLQDEDHWQDEYERWSWSIDDEEVPDFMSFYIWHKLTSPGSIDKRSERVVRLNFIVLSPHQYVGFVEATVLFREFMENNPIDGRPLCKNFRVGFFEAMRFFYARTICG
jgi:hypothetical protein